MNTRLPDWAAEEIRTEVRWAAGQKDFDYRGVVGYCVQEWIGKGLCDDDGDWEDQARTVADSEFELLCSAGRPRLIPDRGSLADRLSALRTLYDAGAYLVLAKPDKSPCASSLTEPFVPLDEQGHPLRKSDGGCIISRRLVRRRSWNEIASHFEQGGLVLYYGCGYQGLLVLDCDPLDDEVVAYIRSVLGEPVAWYYSSGNWKLPKAEGGKAGYGGHIVYGCSVRDGTDDREFYDDHGNHLGEVFSLCKHVPNKSPGYGFVVWDPIALATALRSPPCSRVFMLETDGASGKGGRGSHRAGGRHGDLISAYRDAVHLYHAGVVDWDGMEMRWNSIDDKHIDTVKNSPDAKRRADPRKECRDMRRWWERKAREDDPPPPDEAPTAEQAMAMVQALTNLSRPKGKKSRRGNPNRAYYMADGECDPDPKKFKRGSMLTPRGLARKTQYRSDHLQRALAVVGKRNGWQLRWQDIRPLVAASIANGLFDLVGAEGVASDVMNANEFVLDMRKEQVKKKAKRVRVMRDHP